MSYQFPPDLQQRVKALMETGSFKSEDHVLREAVDALERRQKGLAQLQEMVREADQDVVAGRVRPFDAEETKRAVRERFPEQNITE